MKLAMLVSGRSIHAIKWANTLCQRGFEVHLFSLHGFSEALDARVKRQPLPLRAPFGYLLNVPWLRSQLRRLQPELLHSHSASGYGTLGRLSGYHPHILSVWGSDVFRFPERSSFHRRMLVSNLANADWVCSTSHAMAARVRDLSDQVRGISVVPFGIDVDRFAPRPIPGRGTITIGTVKWLKPVYGIDVLVKAFAKCRDHLQRDNPNLASRLRLMLVGSGPQRFELDQLAERLGVASVTRFIGEVSNDDVPRLLRSMDIFVVASRSESFGVSVLEASACGLPVVVTKVGGLPEVVEDGGTGLIVPPDNPDLMAQALSRLARDASLREHFRRGGPDYVRRKYDWDHSVHSMEHVYSRWTSQGNALAV